MNRRGTKKIVIAPKVPILQDTQSETIKNITTTSNPTTTECSEEKLVRRFKGLHVPAQFERSPRFDYMKDNFILSLSNTDNLTLVVFDDGSIGFKRNNILLDLDVLYIGNSAVVELSKEVRKIKDINFIVTGYDV